MLTKEILEEALKEDNIKCNILEFNVLDPADNIAKYQVIYSFIEGHIARKNPPYISLGEYEVLLAVDNDDYIDYIDDDDHLGQIIAEISINADDMGIDTSKFQKKVAMIAQPPNLETLEPDETSEMRKRAIAVLEKNGYKVIDNPIFASYDDEEVKEKRIINTCLYYDTKFLECLAKCHTIYFCKGWENSSRCRILHTVEKEFNLEVIYEQED